ncbi:hypothetical protein FOA43_000211 [Brettanomyces nanus]|uniref:C2H2-type domain-containing protein n=1 Tax=Eeniella nana TaxID=13502 RepID=A0A875RWN1_EENNA|nr:uncharacterized protein FOA43_000211 [Brettanomyces nanus]QPG72908.1 hypothetical protein FOA43_000211 [Brettanomyces nanus]
MTSTAAPSTGINATSGLDPSPGSSPRPELSKKSSPDSSPSTTPSSASPGYSLSQKKSSDVEKQEKARPFICPTCTRAFARLEHLTRHERSHTNEKPFQCAACGRCFARRDLVLRHQQKLHASLPTNNRANAPKRVRGPRVTPKDGEIVSDYLNDNINIVKNNTSKQLPLPKKSKRRGVYLLDKKLDTTEPSDTDYNTPSMPKCKQVEISDSGAGSGSGFKKRKKVLPVSPSQQQINSPAAGSIGSICSIGSRGSSGHDSLSSIQESAPSTFLNLPENIVHQVQNIPSELSHPSQESLQGLIDNNYDSLLMMDNSNLESHFRDQRHASFSAAASGSYTGFPEHHARGAPLDALDTIEQEAPPQVKFSSPQMKHEADGHFGYLNFAELEQLENPNFQGMDDINLDLSPSNLDTNTLLQGLAHENVHDIADHSLPDVSSEHMHLHPEHEYHSLFSHKVTASVSLAHSVVTVPKQMKHNFESSAESSTASSAPGFRTVSTQTPITDSPFSPSQQKAIDATIVEQLQKITSTSTTSDPTSTGEVTKKGPEDWLSEFINAPIEKDFPSVSDHIGFGDSPWTNNTSNNDNSPSANNNDKNLSRYFRSRQLDLSKHISVTEPLQNSVIPRLCSDKIRTYIVNTYHLKESQFPHLEDMNHYLSLYDSEFNKYFPFVHIPSMNVEGHLEEIPLMLSMAAIGALYSFHARNSSTLFNFSRFLIHNFMETRLHLHEFNHVPLHITQALLLHLFLGMFHNDLEVTKLTGRQLTSLVSLAKATRLDMPIESFFLPPALSADISTLNDGSDNSHHQLKTCYDYFILAQSRIRTIHVLHYLSVLFGMFTGSKVELVAEDIRCGTFCVVEDLWKAKTCNEWLNLIKNHDLIVDSKFSLIRLSDGTNSFRDLWHDLTNLTLDRDIGQRSLLSLLMSLNSFIHDERLKIENSSYSEGAKIAKWRMDERPYIESLIKSWETSFVRNGGLLVPKGQNLHVINRSSALKLILPLLSLAKIRKCVYISPVLSAVWTRDWDAMNIEIKKLTRDPEALRDAVTYCLDIVNLWIEIISITKDAEKTSIRTPIFFLTCLFTSTLLISEYLYTSEVWANRYMENEESHQYLATADRVLWLRAERVFKKVENSLLPSSANNTSYSEFLRIQAKGALDVDSLDDKIAMLALDPENVQHIAAIIISGRLSARCLSLGVRILADAPVWPIALVFAEALKARATAIHQHLSTFTPISSSSTGSIKS